MYTKKQIIDGYEAGIFSAREVLGVAGLSNQREAARFFGVTLRTLQRWLEKNRLPRAVVLACRYKCGDLSGIGQGLWEGFTIKGDVLSDEYGNRISRADVLNHNARMYRFVTMEHELEIKREKERAKADAPATDTARTNVVPFRPKS